MDTARNQVGVGVKAVYNDKNNRVFIWFIERGHEVYS